MIGLILMKRELTHTELEKIVEQVLSSERIAGHSPQTLVFVADDLKEYEAFTINSNPQEISVNFTNNLNYVPNEDEVVVYLDEWLRAIPQVS